MAPFTLPLLSMLANSATASRRVFVSGAGGQTGGHVFRKLLALPDFEPVGAVRSEESKAALLETGVPSDSVVVCDVTNFDSCTNAMKGCDAAVICTSAKPAPSGEVDEDSGRPKFGFPNGQPEQVDWFGQKNQIDAAKAVSETTHVVICSSMGGTDPNHPLNNLGKETLEDGTVKGGDILKWKRKAEKYLIDSDLPYTIVHPGGLLNEPGAERELCLGVDDKNTLTDNNSVPREDVAEVMVQALQNDEYRGRSFDLVSKPPGDGTVTTEFIALLAVLGGVSCDYSLGEIA